SRPSHPSTANDRAKTIASPRHSFAVGFIASPEQVGNWVDAFWIHLWEDALIGIKVDVAHRPRSVGAVFTAKTQRTQSAQREENLASLSLRVLRATRNKGRDHDGAVRCSYRTLRSSRFVGRAASCPTLTAANVGHARRARPTHSRLFSNPNRLLFDPDQRTWQPRRA